MKKWNLVVDLDKCNGCFNCFLSAKDEHVGNDFPGYAAPQPLHGHEWIRVRAYERGSAPTMDLAYLPTMCNHCDDAPCVKAGKGAVTKRPDGIVLIDPAKAKGRRDLVASCPYGAIFWNEDLQVPQAWIFDAHLLDQGWEQPRCVQACGTGAMQALKLEDAEMQSRQARDGLEVLQPELGTRPRVYYRNLHRANRVFVAGTVTGVSNGIRDVVAGARVELAQNGSLVSSAITDAFGEFRIDRLQPRSGKFQLTITHALGMTIKQLEVADATICLGELELPHAQNSH